MIDSAMELQEVLFSGDDAEIRKLVEAIGNDYFEYEYSAKADSFSLTTSKEIIRTHGLGFEPNCVHVLGSRFKAQRAVA